MKSIEYRVSFNGGLLPNGTVVGNPSTEIVRVQARDINSGYGKALKRAKEPLGSGVVREIGRIEVWQVL